MSPSLNNSKDSNQGNNILQWNDIFRHFILRCLIPAIIVLVMVSIYGNKSSNDVHWLITDAAVVLGVAAVFGIFTTIYLVIRKIFNI